MTVIRVPYNGHPGKAANNPQGWVKKTERKIGSIRSETSQGMEGFVRWRTSILGRRKQTQRNSERWGTLAAFIPSLQFLNNCS